MAAAPDPNIPRLLELRSLRAGDLNLLLEEEIETWRVNLDWDFHSSASLVRRFVDMRSLSGFCLIANGRAVGYSYYVVEDHKGMIGDLYVLKNFASADNEARLLNAVVAALAKTPLVKRIESQLMMLRAPAGSASPHSRYMRMFPRNYMVRSLDDVPAMVPSAAAKRMAIEPWTDARQDEAGSLISAAYQGHIDSQINDQYRSPGGARRFLSNIVQFPGCGTFLQPASFVATDPLTGRLAGICLSSMVSSDTGHITQICVSKAVRGLGVGYELLRRSLLALTRQGCLQASLTVTAANTEAIQLYERTAFRKTRGFAAQVWEGF